MSDTILVKVARWVKDNLDRTNENEYKPRNQPNKNTMRIRCKTLTNEQCYRCIQLYRIVMNVETYGWADSYYKTEFLHLITQSPDWLCANYIRYLDSHPTENPNDDIKQLLDNFWEIEKNKARALFAVI